MGKEAVRAPFCVRLPAAAAGSQTHKDFFDKLTVFLWEEAHDRSICIRERRERICRTGHAAALCHCVVDGEHVVSAKNFMELFTINFTHPLQVQIADSRNEAHFAKAAARFVVG